MSDPDMKWFWSPRTTPGRVCVRRVTAAVDDPAKFGQLLREYPDHPSTIADIQWQPGAQVLASAAYGQLTLWSPDQANHGRLNLDWANPGRRRPLPPEGPPMVNPIVSRELATILRTRRMLIFQCGLICIFALLVIVRWPSEARMAASGARSQQVFRVFAYGLLTTMLLLLPVFPATNIVREKRQGTLALLLNFRTVREQGAALDRHAKAAVTMCAILCSAGAFNGIPSPCP